MKKKGLKIQLPFITNIWMNYCHQNCYMMTHYFIAKMNIAKD